MYDNILNICHFRVVVSIFIAIMVIGTGYDILMIQLPKMAKRRERRIDHRGRRDITFNQRKEVK
jgi:hypothetical protein